MNLVDDKDVTRMSIEVFEQMKSTMPVSHNADYNERLQRVGARIADVVFWDIPDARWEFVLFDSPEINAFAMAGGKVGVFTGVLQLAESDDELAVVIAHEISHVSAKHVHEKLSREMMVNTGAVALSAAVPMSYGIVGSLSSQAIYAAYGVGTGVVGLGFDREKEREADKIGLIYMARAGYDPNAALTFWNKVDRMSPSENPSASWLSTHPSHANRIAELRDIMPKAEKVYQAAVASGVWE